MCQRKPNRGATPSARGNSEQVPWMGAAPWNRGSEEGNICRRVGAIDGKCQRDLMPPIRIRGCDRRDDLFGVSLSKFGKETHNPFPPREFA